MSAEPHLTITIPFVDKDTILGAICQDLRLVINPGHGEVIDRLKEQGFKIYTESEVPMGEIWLHSFALESNWGRLVVPPRRCYHGGVYRGEICGKCGGIVA